MSNTRGAMTSSVRLFTKFLNHSSILIETGTWMGEGVERAFVSGFKTVRSCDINKKNVDRASQKFTEKDFYAICQSSELAIPIFLSEFDSRCVIFLDAHAMPPTSKSKTFSKSTLGDGSPFPLIEEILAISRHCVKDHVILIDDIQCFDTWMFDFVKINDVINLVKCINPYYKHEIHENVLCFYCEI